MNYYQRIYNEARRFSFPAVLSNLIAAQGSHESGNFTSAIFLNCSNSFGYKSTSTLNSCSYNSAYKKYDSIEQSTDEIINWIKRRQSEGNFPQDLNQIKTPSDYAFYLKQSGYYEDSQTNYAAGIARALETMPGFAPLTLAAGIGLFVVLLVRKKK